MSSCFEILKLDYQHAKQIIKIVIISKNICEK